MDTTNIEIWNQHRRQQCALLDRLEDNDFPLEEGLRQLAFIVAQQLAVVETVHLSGDDLEILRASRRSSAPALQISKDGSSSWIAGNFPATHLNPSQTLFLLRLHSRRGKQSVADLCLPGAGEPRPEVLDRRGGFSWIQLSFDRRCWSGTSRSANEPNTPGLKQLLGDWLASDRGRGVWFKEKPILENPEDAPWIGPWFEGE